MTDIITTTVKRIVAGSLCVEPSKVTDDADLRDALSADSFDMIKLALDIEAAFGFEIPDAEIEKLKTVQDIIDYVKKATNA